MATQEMKRIVIFGNSGSGKSTLATRLAAELGVTHFDLDTIAWESPGLRKELAKSIGELRAFIGAHHSWVIEGCYGSLIEDAAKEASDLIFLNPGIEECQRNCRERPWEPHKYESKEKQEENLEMLLNWVADYATRDDEFSQQAHRKIFDSHPGRKQEVNSNEEARRIEARNRRV